MRYNEDIYFIKFSRSSTSWDLGIYKTLCRTLSKTGYTFTIYCPAGGILFYSSGQKNLGADTTINQISSTVRDIRIFGGVRIPSVRYDPTGRAVLCETS